jgi:hypothetical protein
MSAVANLSAPYGGQDSQTPTAVLKFPACEYLYNCNTTPAGISVRNGDSKWAAKLVDSSGGVTAESFAGLAQYGESQLFLVVRCFPISTNRIYSVSTEGGVPTLVYSSPTNRGNVYSVYFAGRLFVYAFDNSTVPVIGGDQYDGTTWSGITYTFPALSFPLGGCAYKNRQYFVFKSSATYGYSGIDAVSGAVTAVNLSGVISESSSISTITQVTISNEISSQVLLAFVFFSGEVLFYAGSYPDSADWGLVGRATIDNPIDYHSTISNYQGDTLVATRSGLISLRDLFLRGSEQATNLSLSKSITPDWVSLIQAIDRLNGYGSLSYIKLVWWKKKNRLVIVIPYQLDSTDNTADLGSTFFVYDTINLSWSVHRSFGGNYSLFAAVFQDNLVYGASSLATATDYILLRSKEKATDFQDVNQDNTTKTSFDYEMLSAPIPFPKTAVYEATQIEPILESDLYSQTNWNFVVDFGRQTSGDQKTDASTTSVAKPAVNVGMQNITYVQVKMSGTTAASKTVGLNLYSYNVWFNAGEKGSR